MLPDACGLAQRVERGEGDGRGEEAGGKSWGKATYPELLEVGELRDALDELDLVVPDVEGAEFELVSALASGSPVEVVGMRIGLGPVAIAFGLSIGVCFGFGIGFGVGIGLDFGFGLSGGQHVTPNRARDPVTRLAPCALGALGARTYILLQPLNLLQPVMAQIQLLEVDEPLEPLHLGDAVALDTEDLEVGECVETLELADLVLAEPQFGEVDELLDVLDDLV